MATAVFFFVVALVALKLGFDKLHHEDTQLSKELETSSGNAAAAIHLGRQAARRSGVMYMIIAFLMTGLGILQYNAAEDRQQQLNKRVDEVMRRLMEDSKANPNS